MIIPPEYQKVTGIYFIKNRHSGSLYIGSASNVYQRLHDHYFALKNNKHGNRHLQNSFNKWRIENFQVGLLCQCTREELIVKEQQFIDQYKPAFNKNLTVSQPYNIKWTTRRRRQHSKIRRQAFREGRIIIWWKKKVSAFNDKGKRIATFESVTDARKKLVKKSRKLKIGKRYKGIRLLEGWDTEKIDAYTKPRRKDCKH